MRKQIESPSAELKNFTNRQSEQEILHSLIMAPEGTALPVTMFYGVGGAGKSWLLRKLMGEVRQEPYSSWSFPKLPIARIDFDPSSNGSAYYTNYGAALSEIVAQFEIECPRFELAYAMLLYKQLGGEEPEMKGGVGAAATAFRLVTKIGSTLAESKLVEIAETLVEEFGPDGGKSFRDTELGKWILNRVGQQDYVTLAAMRPLDIYPTLMQRLEEDLRDELPARPGFACRAIIEFDTVEALQLRASDSWMRALYEQCSFQKSNFLLFVAAGQNRLPWDDIDADWSNPACLKQVLLGGLSSLDADRFLIKCGVGDIEERCGLQSGELLTALRNSSQDMDAAKVSSTPAYHPLSLAILADTVREQACPDPELFRLTPGNFDVLAERFLRCLGDAYGNVRRSWIVHLALTPRFDSTAAQARYSTAESEERTTAWDTFLDYSFVTEAGTGLKGWWTLKALMRSAICNGSIGRNIDFQAEHSWWRDYWRSRSAEVTDEYAALAWYHDWIIEPQQALLTWSNLAKQLRTRLNMTAHLHLLDWWAPTNVEIGTPDNEVRANGLISLAAELSQASIGNRAANLSRAIGDFQATMLYFTEQDHPREWASAQHILGNTLLDLPTGDRNQNIHRAIEAYQSALNVRTETSDPHGWAETQNGLGNAYRNLPTGDRIHNLTQAIGYYQAALRVYTEQADPANWAMSTNNLAIAYCVYPSADPSRNLAHAIEAFTSVLRVYTENAFPKDWAMTQNNLGNAYRALMSGDRNRNLALAIDAYQAALRVRTEPAFPHDWASTQNNLGCAYLVLPDGDRGANLANAISSFEAALRVHTEIAYPQDWALIQNNLAAAYCQTPRGDRGENLALGIQAFQNALRVRSEATNPVDWAMIQSNLGNAYLALPTGDRSENLKSAIGFYDAALRVYEKGAFPGELAIVTRSLDYTRGLLSALPSPGTTSQS